MLSIAQEITKIQVMFQRFSPEIAPPFQRGPSRIRRGSPLLELGRGLGSELAVLGVQDRAQNDILEFDDCPLGL